VEEDVTGIRLAVIVLVIVESPNTRDADIDGHLFPPPKIHVLRLAARRVVPAPIIA
jgi:hypothetical protein